VNNCTRRGFGSVFLGGGAWAATRPSNADDGVLIGVQGWSFRDRPLDDAIRATTDAGLNAMELGWNHLEPSRLSRAEMRDWRLSVPLDTFKHIREEFQARGVKLVGYSATLRKDFTDAEIDKTFQMASALGVDTITTSTNVSMAGRLDEYATKHHIRVGFHNHSRIRPDEFATPQDFVHAMAGRSKYIGINLDVGHFWAAGFDPVAFTREKHARIWSIHLKDRKRYQGPDFPFGQGDTPLKQLLLLVKREKYGIPSFIERESKEGDPVAEVRKCAEYCRNVLSGSV
jgi:sugar phosphate isomerase/epimerase